MDSAWTVHGQCMECTVHAVSYLSESVSKLEARTSFTSQSYPLARRRKVPFQRTSSESDSASVRECSVQVRIFHDNFVRKRVLALLVQ